MTREEKINLLNELLEHEEKNDIGNLTRAERGDFQQWVKALDSKPILDKIRAEIKALTSNRGFLSCSVDYIHEKIDAVFDKYKAESEEV